MSESDSLLMENYNFENILDDTINVDGNVRQGSSNSSSLKEGMAFLDAFGPCHQNSQRIGIIVICYNKNRS